tara:strand:- start:2352 stop:2855 length:504 start_codon:yes stop_codon:yes gene_type:complete
MSHVLKLTDDELAYCKELGVKRHMAKKPSFRNSRNLRKQGFEGEIHMIGVIGEYAYHKVTGSKLDENIYATGDAGYDFEDDGSKIEVKVSTYGPVGTELKIPKKEYERIKPDQYVLVYVNKNNLKDVTVLGKISRKTFDKKKREKQYGPRYPVNYIVGAEELDALDV